uniref:Uncharacterized protein n=1 Tax=Lepeophtheirus salmonis TaxID=72036 RepID=A0A0K2U1T4_LEPSM
MKLSLKLNDHYFFKILLLTLVVCVLSVEVKNSQRMFIGGGERIQFNFYCLSELCSDFVEIEFSVRINSDLTFNLYHKNVYLDRSCVNHLTTNRKITSVSLLQNILAHMKSIPFPPMEDMINALINDVESIIENLYPSDIDSQKRKKLIFIREQLALINSTPKQKRYTPVLLATSLLWHNTSPALYRQLSQDGLTLPSLSHLKKLSNQFTFSR